MFTYKIGFRKKEGSYALSYYNSPYNQSEQELDDIKAIMDLEGYKVVKWETLPNGNYEAVVECQYIPNGDDTYDQAFALRELRPLDVDNSR